MTNTLTTDIKGLQLNQINTKFIVRQELILVRVSCPDEESSKGFKRNCKDHIDVPIVADIHFHYKRAIEAADQWRGVV